VSEVCLFALAWRDRAGAPPAGWRAEPTLADQSALDRAGSKGRTPPPFDVLLWAPGATPLELPSALGPATATWLALRLRPRPAWDDAASSGVRPQVKQVSLLHAREDLGPGEFARHFREHVDVARLHHPAICRYTQHDVIEQAGPAERSVQGVSELWFPDEATLVDRYFAGPDSVPVVRADNREYIDFRGTLSLLVRPDDAAP
jgi:hypothetical protein